MKYERTIVVQKDETEEASPLVKVILTMEEAEILTPYVAILNRIKRTHKFNGFRPGKVPNAIVEAKFGRTAMDTVITDNVNDFIRQIAKEHGDTVLFKPIISPDAKQPNPEDTLVLEVIYFRKVVSEGGVGPDGVEGEKGPEGDLPMRVTGKSPYLNLPKEMQGGFRRDEMHVATSASTMEWTPPSAQELAERASEMLPKVEEESVLQYVDEAPFYSTTTGGLLLPDQPDDPKRSSILNPIAPNYKLEGIRD